MRRNTDQAVVDAISSMLRTDYISLNDVEKLELLGQYYVDYFGYLPQILTDSDQLLVGRRGTGKTTLAYRAFVECMRSWEGDGSSSMTRPRTLGIYIDLSKCQSLDSPGPGDFVDFEHVFVTELVESISSQLHRFWPSLAGEPNLVRRLFRAADQRQAMQVQRALGQLVDLLEKGVPRSSSTAPVGIEEKHRRKSSTAGDARASVAVKEPGANVAFHADAESEFTRTMTTTEHTIYRLQVADVLRILQQLRERASIPAIYVYVDEFSALSGHLQGRFTTLLRKILGSHAGVFIKLCAITDSYTLGSSIILQRDLFEVSLDLDAYVERSGSLPQAMAGLKEQAERIVQQRLKAYACPPPEVLFDDASDAWGLLSLEAMGVPRTLGIVLQQAWNRRQSSGAQRIRKADLEYGIAYASRAYLNQLLGATKGSVAIPSHVAEVWYALLERATAERRKQPRPASHFMIKPHHEEIVKYLSMCFLVHLLSSSRTTKKDRASRSLYCFDYGICVENNLAFTQDKNVMRQQRFVYDDVLQPFEPYYTRGGEPTFRCSQCGKVYRESEILVMGKPLPWCPDDRADLRPVSHVGADTSYTEEEVKIIGAMRMATPDDELIARQVADDVGCYVQKVAKFGEKLERETMIGREKSETADRFIYYGPQQPQEKH